VDDVPRVTLPLALPGVLAGAALAWARSLGEFGATITFAGNYPGTTQTMPSLIYTELQSDPLVARTVSMVLLVVSIGVLVLLRNRWLTRTVTALELSLTVPGRVQATAIADRRPGRGGDRAQRRRQDLAPPRRRRSGAAVGGPRVEGARGSTCPCASGRWGWPSRASCCFPT
jgi:hypothetical protein